MVWDKVCSTDSSIPFTLIIYQQTNPPVCSLPVNIYVDLYICRLYISFIDLYISPGFSTSGTHPQSGDMKRFWGMRARFNDHIFFHKFLFCKLLKLIH